ncbi:hypothetical protein MTO96_014246 [Rhipicephalus appendiculatus]
MVYARVTRFGRDVTRSKASSRFKPTTGEPAYREASAVTIRADITIFNIPRRRRCQTRGGRVKSCQKGRWGFRYLSALFARRRKQACQASLYFTPEKRLREMTPVFEVYARVYELLASLPGCWEGHNAIKVDKFG